MNHLEKYGPKLIAMGYDIIPLKHKKKFPGIKGWQNTEAKVEDIPGWVSTGHTGVGILSKKTPAVDLDIRNRDMTLFMIKSLHEICGQAPYRVGQKPKALLPFKVINSFRKLSSRKFIDPEGNQNQVEILGDGGQFVAFGIHPDTGEDYKWNKPLSEIPRSSLPTLGINDAKEIIKLFEEECEKRGWTPSGQTGNEKQESAEPTTASTPINKDRLGLDIDKMRIYLALVDPADKDYDEWLKVGMCIHHETSGSGAGFLLWDEWSQRSPTHDEKCKGTPMRKKWDSFSANGTGNASTFRSVIKEANANRKDNLDGIEGVTDPKLVEYLKRYVYIASEDKVHDLWGPQELPNLPLKNFKTDMSHDQMVVMVPKEKTDKETGEKYIDYAEKKVLVVDQWIKSEHRQKVRGMIYWPERVPKRMIERYGHKWLNSYRPPKHTRPDGGLEELEKKIQPFLRHMEYVFEYENEREWFLDWMALNVQHPENRCKVTPLHTVKNQGVGRGWLIVVLRALLGTWNCKAIDMKLMVDSSFNSYMANSLLVFVDEVHEPGREGWATLDKIRDKLTEDKVMINIKGVPEFEADVHCNFFLMSNHLNALRMDEKDRRINVFSCMNDPAQFPGGRVALDKYFMEIYDWAGKNRGGSRTGGEESEGIRALYWWLMERDLSGMSWQRSFDTPGRRRMIQMSQNPVEEMFLALIEEPPYPVMTENGVLAWLGEESGDGWSMLDHRSQVRKLLGDHCDRPRDRIRIGGRGSKKVCPWVLKRGENYTLEEMQNILQEQQNV